MFAGRKKTFVAVAQPQRQARPRWHLLFYSLAIFDLLTVSLSLIFGYHVRRKYTHAVEENQQWVVRLQDYAALGELAAAVNAPGSDVFASGDVRAEAQRVALAERLFNQRLAALRAEIQTTPGAPSTTTLLAQLDAAQAAMDQMTDESALIFTYLSRNEPRQAAARVGTMDGQYATLTVALTRLRHEVSRIQQMLLSRQAEAAAALQRFEYVIATFIVLMIGGATHYGSRLARQMEIAGRERERFITELSAAETRTRTILDTAADGIITFDEDGVIESCNAATEHIFGYTAAELRGSPIARLVSSPIEAPEDANPGALAADPATRPGVPCEMMGRRKVGTTFYMDWIVSEMHLSTKRMFTGIARDITTRKAIEQELLNARDDLELRVQERTRELGAANELLLRELSKREQAEAAVRESEERFRLLFEHSPDAHLLLDPHHSSGAWTIVACNDAACRMHGYSRDELIGQSFELLNAEKQGPGEHTAFLMQLQRQSALQGDRLHRRKDDSTFPFEYAATLITVGGRELVLSIGRDVAERKQVEAALQESAVLRRTDRLTSQLIANVSHELRTPLHHIRGYALTLLNPRLNLDPDDIRDALQIIVEESQRLEHLVADLLQTGLIDGGSLRLEIESVHLDEVIRRVVSRWQTHATHRFETRFPRSVPPIAADSHRLEQVLDNLLSNVVKYTPEGTQTEIVLAVSRTALQISVRDNGPGIEAEHLPRLFDRFYQAEPPGFGSRRGNGLGLFICKAIVEQHGGQITVDSTREIGTSFSIILPRQRTGTLKVPSSALLEEGESSLELATGDL